LLDTKGNKNVNSIDIPKP